MKLGGGFRERRGKAVAGVRVGAFMRTQRGGEEARERGWRRGQAARRDYGGCRPAGGRGSA
jgi:hypothetical protein